MMSLRLSSTLLQKINNIPHNATIRRRGIRANTSDGYTALTVAESVTNEATTMEQNMECQIWNLERYARMTSHLCKTSSTVSQDGWEHFGNQTESLELTITASNHILIHHGKKQMECLSLVGVVSLLKGVSKGDSLMVVYKAQDQARRFRVKFSPSADGTGEVVCRACVERLSKHFLIKVPETAVSGSNSQMVANTPRSTPGDDSSLVGDVTIGQLAHAVGSNTMKLPELYSRLGDGTEYELATLIKLCLTDSSFPAFVGQIEQELDKIKEESA